MEKTNEVCINNLELINSTAQILHIIIWNSIQLNKPTDVKEIYKKVLKQIDISTIEYICDSLWNSGELLMRYTDRDEINKYKLTSMLYM